MATTKSILLVGGSGFLGTNLALRLREDYKVFATYHKHPISIPNVTFLPFDVENRDWIKKVVSSIQPDIVIYMAGNNNVEWCAKNASEAERLHTDGPATLAILTDIMQPRFIFLSNPYVFDGIQGNYHEEDMVLPGTQLGRLKSGGENVVRSKCLNYIILRSSPLFGRSNGNNLSFLDRLRMSLDKNERVEMHTHELHSFAPAEGFSSLVHRLIESGVRNRILHYGGITKVTYYEFAKMFAKHFGYNTDLILPKTMKTRKSGIDEDFIFDFSLNSTQATQTLKIKPLLLEEGFDLVQKELIPGF